MQEKVCGGRGTLSVLLAVVFLAALVSAGCNKQSSADTDEKINKSAIVRLINEYYQEYPHTILEVSPDEDLEWYYPVEQYRQNIRLEILEVEITDIAEEKNSYIPFKVALLASVVHHRNIDYYPGRLLDGLPRKFARMRVFYYGVSDYDKPFLKDMQGRTIYYN
jgi:hypothetical protein